MINTVDVFLLCEHLGILGKMCAAPETTEPRTTHYYAEIGARVHDLRPRTRMCAQGDCMLKRSRLTGLTLALLGLLVLLNNLSKPRVEALHGSDVLGLVASGICFGAAFVGLIGRLKIRDE